MDEFESGVYVRAIDGNGKWGSCDAMHLSNKSFRAFTLMSLRAIGAVVHLGHDSVPEYKTRQGFIHPTNEED